MKTKKLFSISLLFVASLCVVAFAQTTRDKPQSQVPTIRINPALVGLQAIHVAVVPYGVELNNYALYWGQLKINIEQNITRAGLQRAPLLSRNYAARSLDFPELLVEIHFFEPPGAQITAFRVRTMFITDIGLRRTSTQLERTEVWSTGTMVIIPSPGAMPAIVDDLVKDQVDMFISAWSTANPTITKQPAPPEPNETDYSNVPPPAPKKRIKSVPEPNTTQQQYSYVASKKQSIFHKPDCRFAKRIKTENIVGYNERRDALRDGKRPCAACKP
jgi:hypothetical protein